jgi:hypothetical protein
MGANYAKLKNDISISGKTVQEMLQTGEKSLQAALNAKSAQLKKDDPDFVPDEFIILFPTAGGSATPPKGGTETSSSATTAPAAPADNMQIMNKLGVTKDSATGLMIQDKAACNALGKAAISFSPDSKGDAPTNKEKDLVDEKGNVIRGKNVINFKESDFRFSQNTDIFNAINQTLLQSQFPGKTLDPANISKEGYKGWWRIETQVFIKPTKANYAKTNQRPRIIVYRIVPYDVHISKMPSVNVQPYGIDALKKTAVKQYEYIYTGKNVDIIKFNIEHSASYYQKMGSDGFRTVDQIIKDKEAAAQKKEAAIKGTPNGSLPSGKSGEQSREIAPAVVETNTDNMGGGGVETAATRAARMFHDAVTEGTDTQRLSMDIIGDPYYIAQSGTGNYIAKPESHNLNVDGTINYQSGEVDIHVNFRSPSDLNQSTGLYNIDRSNPNTKKSTPVLGFSGLYYIVKLVNHFKNGAFTQSLECLRRPNQELTKKGTKEQGYNTKTPSAEAFAMKASNPNEQRTPEEIQASLDLKNAGGI